MPDLALDTTAAGDGTLAELSSVVRKVAADLRGSGDEPARLRRYADLGWLSLLVPQRRGGAEAGERAAAVVARGLGRAADRAPYAAAVLAIRCLAALPEAAAVERLLGAAMSGERLVVPAWQDEVGDPLPDVGPLHVGPDGALSGTVCWVPAARADTYLVSGHGPDGPLLVALDATAEGVRVQSWPAADGTEWARLHCRDVRSGLVLATGPAARAALRDAVEVATVLCAAELVGLVDRMLELTVHHVGTRRQFGRPIGSFQVVAHRVVDMWMHQRLADGALDGALHRFADPAQRAAAASGAKARASATALRVANESVQLHGAIGFTDEYELGRYVNRALVLAAWLGTASSHARRHDQLRREAG